MQELSFRRNPAANLSMSSLILCLDSCGMTKESKEYAGVVIDCVESSISVGNQARIVP